MKDQLITLVRNSRNYTMAVVDAMPRENFDARPTVNAWTFLELISHIAYGINWSVDNYLKGLKTEWAEPKPKGNFKAFKDYLTEAYDSLEQVVIEGTNIDDDTFKQGLYATLDHITHHRGQAVLRLRIEGFVPPEYQY